MLRMYQSFGACSPGWMKPSSIAAAVGLRPREVVYVVDFSMRTLPSIQTSLMNPMARILPLGSKSSDAATLSAVVVVEDTAVVVGAEASVEVVSSESSAEVLVTTVSSSERFCTAQRPPCYDSHGGKHYSEPAYKQIPHGRGSRLR